MKFAALRKRFQEQFPASGEPGLCRAPGRVNLIGEHTDYNGLSVLPMAITQELRVAFGPRNDNKIVLHNVDRIYPEAAFENAGEIPRSNNGQWENYCKAAVTALNRHFKLRKYKGMNLLVSGDLPVASGLSSSSALVVICALCYLKILGRSLGGCISRLELAELLAEGEHYVGTRGGGMDQTVILNATDSHACKIDFFPLRVESAPLPKGCAIVVCNSMIKVQKSGEALARYNMGPRLCSIACALVEKQLQQEFDDEIRIGHLGDLWFGSLCLTHQEVQDVCARAVPTPRMNLTQMAKRLEFSPQEIRDRWIDGLPEPENGFGLQARLRHVVTEFQRVEMARDALLAGDSWTFGHLMNASHKSCAKDFKISCPELDMLVKIARESGAIGARLTGAGFGGATVNLVPEEKCEEFVDQVAQGYYRDYMHFEGDAPIFVANATRGAGYI